MCTTALMHVCHWAFGLYSSLLGLHSELDAWPAYRGYLVDTGQEFINSREQGKDGEAFEFDSGMGVLPEAIDMSGTLCCAAEGGSILSTSESLVRSAVTQVVAHAVHRSFY